MNKILALAIFIVLLLAGPLFLVENHSVIRVPADFMSISAALNDAAVGSIILVDASQGPYIGGILIDIPQIQLRSINGRAVINGDEENPTIRVEADEVKLFGFEVRGGATGIVIENASQVEVKEVLVEGNLLGVGIIDSRNILFSHNRVISNESIGILLSASSANGFIANVIEDNPIGGIFLEGDSSENRFEDIQILRSDMGMRFISSPNNVVTRGAFSNNSTYGISVESSENLTFLHSSFVKNGVALDLVNGSRSEIFDNEFADNGVAVWIRGAAADVTVSRNSFIQNQRYALQNESHFEIDATNNYWGNIAGPEFCETSDKLFNAVCGATRVEPWIVNPVE
jgi:hypothetical protein